MLGYRLSNDDIAVIFKTEIAAYIKKHNLDVNDPDDFSEALHEVCYEKDIFSDDNSFIMGQVLADIDCGQIDNKQYTLEDLAVMASSIASEHGVGTENIQLLLGTRCC